MRRLLRVAAVLAALAVGGVVAYLTRPRATVRGAGRPAAVERVTKALDRLDPAAPADLSASLAAAGAASGYPSPWREELELAALVLAKDRPALERFAAASPPQPARARARLRLALEAKEPASRTAALGTLKDAYPASAAARVFAPRPRGDGR